MSTLSNMRILYIEPFHAGSHAAFTRTVTEGIDADWTLITLPGRHWKWRMRGVAAHLVQDHASILEAPYDLLFASSYLPLAELTGLAPGLFEVPSVLYFHENQLAYPMRPEFSGERDLHFGVTQLVAALAADRCVFNSHHNLSSFLAAGDELIHSMPDCVPTGWIERIDDRSSVLPVPLDLPELDPGALVDDPPGVARAQGPIILWNHRREHDKRPDAFFAVLRALDERNVRFRVALCGERFQREPECFAQARPWLAARIVHDGYLDGRDAYLSLLGRCHLAVSTADHEFFGISILEAAHMGAHPLAPDRLAYPETLPDEYRYADDDALDDTLESLCRRWTAGDLDLRCDRRSITSPFAPEHLLPEYEALFAATALLA